MEYQQQPHEQEIDLRDYLRILIKHRNIIITVTILVVAIAVLKVFTATPYYVASAKLLIERNYNGQIGGNMYIPYDPEFLKTQFDIIQSRGVISRVVKKLKLDTEYKHYFFKQDNHSFIAPVTAWFNNAIYGTINWMLASDSDNETAQNSAGPSLYSQVKPVTEADIIASIIQSRLRVHPIRETKIVAISYMDENPVLASLIVNAIADAYMDEMLDIKMNASRHSIKWMTRKAEEEKKKLEAAENALQKYMQEHSIVTVQNKLAVLPQKLAQFSTELSKAQTERKELEDIYMQIKQAGNNQAVLESLPIFSVNQTLQSLRDQILKANQHITELSKKYGPKHPVMIKALEDRRVLLGEKKKEIQRIVQTTEMKYRLAKAREENLRDLLEKTKQQLINLKGKMIQYDILKKQAEINSALYDTLIMRIKQETANEQTQTVNIWMISRAEVPDYPAVPRKGRTILLALVLGLFGGIGIAFLIEYLDNTVKSAKEIEEKIGIPVLATLADIKDRDKNSKESIDDEVLKHPRGQLAENLRTLRSQLMLSSAEHPPRTILISSAVPGEGKTSLAANLAAILCEAKNKVLMIDCDMRKARMHRVYNIVNEKGLSSFLAGEAKEGEIIARLTDHDIHVIPSGPIPPNPAELLISQRMNRLVKHMRDKYDFILFDSPPILSVTDAQILSKIADGTIIVVRAASTTFEQLESTLKLFTSVNAHILGIVLNRMDLSKHGYSYYPGYYSYYYQYKTTDK